MLTMFFGSNAGWAETKIGSLKAIPSDRVRRPCVRHANPVAVAVEAIVGGALAEAGDGIGRLNEDPQGRPLGIEGEARPFAQIGRFTAQEAWLG
jgi:hypothetical protein